MKKILIFAGAVGVAIASSTVTIAANNLYANDIRKFSVDTVSLWDGKVAVFDDGPNKCYVASYANGGDKAAIAISCVKK